MGSSRDARRGFRDKDKTGLVRLRLLSAAVVLLLATNAATTILLLQSRRSRVVSEAAGGVPSDLPSKSTSGVPSDSSNGINAATISGSRESYIDGDDLIEAAYGELDEVRETRRRQLSEYLDRMQSSAHAAGDDTDLHDLFELLQRFHRLERVTDPLADASESKRMLREAMLSHAVQHYRSFHDILFVDLDGEVFNAAFRTDHLAKNLLTGVLGGTELALRLKATPSEAFVIFDDGEIANEATGWFVEPVYTAAELTGWVILQCTMHRINDIFAWDDHLGRSGEVFLVNRDFRMLTTSRFSREPTILGLHLSPENIQSKFVEGKGRKLVIDYRGFRALTSFEVYHMLGSDWLLVAKIDEAEVVTDYFRFDRERHRPDLLEVVGSFPVPEVDAEWPVFQNPAVVDMDEFRRADAGGRLRTAGVSTCTSVVICLPGGFAYMAHVSSYDALHGGRDFDLLGNMVKRVRIYEIPPYQQRQLRVVVVATHMNSISMAIDRLVDEGFFLTQIRFLYNPAASSADIYHDVDTGRSVVRWRFDDSVTSAIVRSADVTLSVGELARRLWVKTTG